MIKPLELNKIIYFSVFLFILLLFLIFLLCLFCLSVFFCYAAILTFLLYQELIQLDLIQL